MALLVTQAQAELSQRLGPCAALVNLNSCLARGWRSLGRTTADPVALADSDLAGLAQSDVDQLYDVAEWTGVARILNNLDPLELRRAAIDEPVADLERRFKAREERLRAWIDRAYGVGLQPLVGGTIGLDFQAANDSIPDPAF